MSTTVRVSEQTRDRVSALATATGRNMSQVIDDAVADYGRRMFWQAFEEGYERLAGDPSARAAIESERRGESPSLVDGLE